MQTLSETIQKMQAERKPAPMGISISAFKTLRLFITMVIAMSALNPPHQPDADGEEATTLHRGEDHADTGNEGKASTGKDTIMRERSVLGLPHPGFFAGSHPWLGPTLGFVHYGAQILVLQLASWDLIGWPSLPQARIAAVDKIELAGMAMVVLGGMLRLWCYSEMEEMFTFQLTLREDHKLITTGPYTYIRHPSYVGLLFILLGIITPVHLASKTHILTALLPFKVPPSTGIAVALVMTFSYAKLMNERAEVEEGMMKEHFGKEYEEYKRRTEKFVPFVW